MHWQLVTNVKHCDVKSFCKFFFFLTLLIYLIYQGGQLELSNEFFHEVKPGLSSYADNPKQVSTEICSKEKKMIVSLPPPPLSNQIVSFGLVPITLPSSWNLIYDQVFF